MWNFMCEPFSSFLGEGNDGDVGFAGNTGGILPAGTFLHGRRDSA